MLCVRGGFLFSVVRDFFLVVLLMIFRCLLLESRILDSVKFDYYRVFFMDVCVMTLIHTCLSVRSNKSLLQHLPVYLPSSPTP